MPPLAPDADRRRSDLQKGWYWGSLDFAEGALEAAHKAIQGKRHRNYRGAAERREHGERRAERLLREGLAAAQLTQEEVTRLRGSDPVKVAIASAIRAQTTVSLSWLAERLALCSAANASQQMRRQKLQPPRLPKAVERWRRRLSEIAP